MANYSGIFQTTHDSDCWITGSKYLTVALYVLSSTGFYFRGIGMRRKFALVAVAVVALLAVGGWYWGSPLYAMSQLKSAAMEGDAEALEDNIDFPKVRGSVKSQMRAAMAAELVKDDDNPFGKLGAMMAMGMIDGIVDGLVTPEGMAAMIAEGKMQKPRTTSASSGSADKKPVEWTVERKGWDRFTAKPVVAAGQAAPSLQFERDGLGWKLAGIKIPPRPAK
ncbi:DUF2939 domain-containing protein [Tsuneonella rigui]|uniref:DUF2939 domain-containing protein n=1 Tax=Tsuneonella rigui TaxID=1708790 RepID=UPI0013E02729|nr:DUF2939 domain-containing protein [Tsuneonella rigui]